MSLRTALFIRFGLLGVGAVLLFTLAYLFYGFLPLVNRIASGEFDTTILRAENLLREPFSLAENVVEVARGWGGPRWLDPDRPAQLNERFQPILQAIPQATSVVAGTTDGLGWLLLQLPDGRWHNRFTDLPKRGNEQLYFDWQGDRLTQRYLKRVDYDPRQRLWFKMAMAAPADGRPHWTPPYKFFTTGEPGITVSVRRDFPDNQSLVVGMDLKLVDISTISGHLAVGKNGYVLVLTDAGEILGLPRQGVLGGSRKESPILTRAEDLGLEPVKLALELWHKDKKAYLKPEVVTAQGERWLFVMHPLPLGEQTFWIAAFAPAADFLPSFYNIGKALLACLALVLALTFVASRRQARRISLPLEAIAESSSRIARLDFSQSLTINSRWREVNALVAAQAHMVRMLSDFQETVSSQADELKQQVHILRDTQAQLQRTLHQEQVILDNALSGILFVRDRIILRVNQRASEIFGFGNIQAMLGISSEFMFEDHEMFTSVGEQAYDALARGNRYGKELLLKRRDGSFFWAYIQGRALDHADALGGGTVWIVTDLTERKELDRMKDEMLSAVGHEVRTPLTAMMGYTELMMTTELPVEQRKEFLGIILHETERLAELFDNFLNLQTLKSLDVPLNYHPVDVGDVLKGAVDLFKGASAVHQLCLECPPGLAVRGDAEQLHRVFLNLISNAIKYSPEGGAVTVSAAQAGDAVLIKVTDAGIGIPPAAREQIFESFFRVDNRNNRRIGGTGLGLALAKETVNKHGGHIWVESTPGKGSTFFITLPALAPG